MYISYIDQFVVAPIFNYLIGAKDVDVEEWQAGHRQAIHGFRAIRGWPGSAVGPENPS